MTTTSDIKHSNFHRLIYKPVSHSKDTMDRVVKKINAHALQSVASALTGDALAKPKAVITQGGNNFAFLQTYRPTERNHRALGNSTPQKIYKRLFE